MDFELNNQLANDDVFGLLAEIEEIVEGASRVPLTGKVMVDGDSVLELVDRIKSRMPEEVKQAQEILNTSDELLANINAQGQKILDDARAQAEFMMLETEIVKMAQNEAEAIMAEATKYGDDVVAKATAQAEHVATEAEDYIESILTHLETSVDKVARSIKSTHESFEDNKR